jgi:hypothetical protein
MPGIFLAGEKLDLPSGSRTLLARRLLLVPKLKTGQEGSALISYSKLPSKSKAPEDKKSIQISTCFWQNSICPRHQTKNKLVMGNQQWPS